MSSTDIVKAEVINKPIVVDDGDYSMFLDTKKFDHAWRVGSLLAKSDLVPQQYKGKVENCVLAFNMAMRLKIEPIQLMQNTYIIQGKPGMEAKLVIALVNARGPFLGPIQYKFGGEGATRSCTAYAKHKTTTEVCEATVTWKMVAAEGWNKKPGSKWNTMPDLMFQYRSATFLARLYCPEVILGFQTIDELVDVGERVKTEKVVEVSPLQAKIKPVENTALDDFTVAPTVCARHDLALSKMEDGTLYCEECQADNSNGNPAPEPDQGAEKPKTRRSRCAGCEKLFDKDKLASTKEGLMCFPCRATAQACDEHEASLGAQEPAQDTEQHGATKWEGTVALEERFYCNGCGHTDPQCATTASGELKCINCFALKVVDRIPE